MRNFFVGFIHLESLFLCPIVQILTSDGFHYLPISVTQRGMQNELDLEEYFQGLDHCHFLN